MDAILAEGKTRKQQANEQALRRLKYLHTSLFPTHKEKNFSRWEKSQGNPMDARSSTNGMRRSVYHMYSTRESRKTVLYVAATQDSA